MVGQTKSLVSSRANSPHRDPPHAQRLPSCRDRSPAISLCSSTFHVLEKAIFDVMRLPNTYMPSPSINLGEDRRRFPVVDSGNSCDNDKRSENLVCVEGELVSKESMDKTKDFTLVSFGPRKGAVACSNMTSGLLVYSCFAEAAVMVSAVRRADGTGLIAILMREHSCSSLLTRLGASPSLSECHS